MFIVHLLIQLCRTQLFNQANRAYIKRIILACNSSSIWSVPLNLSHLSIWIIYSSYWQFAFLCYQRRIHITSVLDQLCHCSPAERERARGFCLTHRFASTPKNKGFDFLPDIGIVSPLNARISCLVDSQALIFWGYHILSRSSLSLPWVQLNFGGLIHFCRTLTTGFLFFPEYRTTHLTRDSLSTRRALHL